MSAVAALRDQAGSFFTWWGGELAALLPHSLVARRPQKPRSEIRISHDGITIDRVAGGIGERYHEVRPIDALDEDGWAELAGVIADTRPRLVLTVPDAYVTSLALPAAARSRLRPAVALQLPQLAPLDPSLLVWSAVPGAAAGGKIKVSVAMARAERIATLQALFAERGLPVPAIAAQAADGLIVLTRSGTGADDAEARANRGAAMLTVLLMLTIPFTTVAGAWLLAGMADSETETIAKQIAPRLAAERRAQREGELGRAIAVVYAHPPATATVEALALGTPDTDFLLAASRAPDGSLAATVDSADPDALQVALAKAPLRPAPQATDIIPIDGKAGRTRIELRSSAR
jgi:hypothetical protein